jgi:hypothetical protein
VFYAGENALSFPETQAACRTPQFCEFGESCEQLFWGNACPRPESMRETAKPVLLKGLYFKLVNEGK